MAIGVGVAFLAAVGFVVRKLAERVNPPQGYVPPPLPAEPRPGQEEDFADAMAWLETPAAGTDRWTPRERQAAFNQALMIDDHDVEQNRAGIITEKQRGYLRKQDMAALLMSGAIAVVAGFMFLNVVLDTIAFGADDWIGATVSLLFFGVMFVSVVGYVWITYTRSPIRFRGGALQRGEGKVEATRNAVYARRGGTRFVYVLKLAGKTFEVPLAVYEQIDPESSYRLMYLEGYKNKLLSIEELG